MLFFPIAAAGVAAAFSVATWRAAPTRDPALRVWSIALAQFAVACAALAWGVGWGWTPLVYRVFYLFGAVLNVAWLALGTVWLMASRRVAAVVNVIFVVAATGAAALVMGTELVPGARRVLATTTLPDGGEVMPAVARMLSRVFSTGGSVVVLAGLVVSIFRRRNVLGLGLLAVGVVIAGVASALVRVGRVELFSVGLTAGIAVMYLGFVKTRR